LNNEIAHPPPRDNPVLTILRQAQIRRTSIASSSRLNRWIAAICA